MFEESLELCLTIRKAWRLICLTDGNRKKRGRQDGRKISLAFINKCLENADTLGIELVIDYANAGRGVVIVLHGKLLIASRGDWWHVEVNSVICNSPELAQQAWNRVFGLIPQVVVKPV